MGAKLCCILLNGAKYQSGSHNVLAPGFCTGFLLRGEIIMDREMVKHMRVQIDSALSDIADGHGFNMRVGNMNYSENGFRATIICEEENEEGLPARFKSEWNDAVSLGLVKEEHFGVVSKDRNGNLFKVVGYDFKKKKNNILLSKVGTDKIYLTTMLHFLKPEFREIKVLQD